MILLNELIEKVCTGWHARLEWGSTFGCNKNYTTGFFGTSPLITQHFGVTSKIG